MKTQNHPVIKSLIDFVDNPGWMINWHKKGGLLSDHIAMLDRRKKARRWLVVLATGWLSVIVWLVVQLAK